MPTRPILTVVTDPPPDDFADFLRSISTARAELNKFQTAVDDTHLFRWAESRMAWERAVAKEHGTRITRIKCSGKLTEAVRQTLQQTDLSPVVRGNLAARNIELAVREAYRVEDAA